MSNRHGLPESLTGRERLPDGLPLIVLQTVAARSMVAKCDIGKM